MINKTLNAITRALYGEFGTGYKYYVETVEQFLTKPCFTVDTLNPMQRSYSPTTYYRTVPIVVHYFSDDEQNLKKDSYEINERIAIALEYITVDDRLIRSETMESQMVDDALQVFVTYRFWTEIADDDLETIDELEDVNTSVTN